MSTTVPDRVHVIWVTCLTDGRDHAVTDEEMAVGMTPARDGGTGDYRTLCGENIVPAPMVCEPRPPCHRCADEARPVRRRVDVADRPRWWRRRGQGAR